LQIKGEQKGGNAMRDCPLKLDEYGISKDAYRELLYFCRQYVEKVNKLRTIRGIQPRVLSDMPRGANTSDTTAKQAAKAIALSRDIEAIEQSAIAASGDMYQYILDNVTKGVRYEYLGIPCGRRQFFNIRRAFFYILATKRNIS
jgi:hypothetical protein